MRILHISERKIGDKNFISGIKSVLLEQVKWENKIENIESKILIYNKEEENKFFLINKKSLKKDILDYNPDFIIFNGFWTLQHYFIARFLKKQNIRYYIKPHGAFNKIAQKNSKIKFIKKIIAKILFFNNYVKNSSGLIFLNEMEKLNSVYHKENEFILPNGIEKLNIKLNSKKVKDENINFIFLGRIDIFTKGLDILLNIILINKDYFIKNNVFFNFYGKGTKKDMNVFNDYLKKIPEIIKYYGVVHGDEKYKALQRNDIFILVSRFEGMPMGVLEALMIGLPCFISKETGMEEYVEKYNMGYINIDKDKLFEDLKNYIEEFKRNIKNKKCYINIKEDLFWKNILSQYKKVYLQIFEIGEI